MKPANLLRTQAQKRSRSISDVSISAHLDLATQPSDHSVTDFAVTTVITFASKHKETFVDLHATEVSSVIINGEEANAAKVYADNRVKLAGLRTDELNEVTIVARCPYSRAGVGLHRFVDPATDEVFVYTQFEPFEAHRVFPCFDQPDIKTIFTFSVDVPDTWTVISNAPVQSTDNGTYIFEPSQSISSYLAAIVGGPYKSITTSHNGIDMALYARGSVFEYVDADEFFEITKQGMDWYKDAFGFDYPFVKYDQVFCPQYNFGAMENPGCVTFTERLIFRSKVTEAERCDRANTILHEMAHMWFGDMVTMQWWDDLWLNESFATFIAHTAVAEATRFGRASWSNFALQLKSWAYLQDQLPSTHPIVADVVDTNSVMSNFDGITYAKGSSVVKQLYSRVGREAFFEGVKIYMQRHAWGNTSMRDFLAALEETSGKSLTGWAEEWLQTCGVETLHVTDTPNPASPNVLNDPILHKEANITYSTLREHRLNLGLYYLVGDQLDHRETITVTAKGATTPLPELHGKPRPDLLLINDDDLTYAKVRFDKRSMQTIRDHLSKIKDPVNRAVVWGSLWDSVRDSALRVDEFVSIMLQHIAVEDDVATQDRLLRQALLAIDRFVPSHLRDEILDTIDTFAMRELALAKDGSDQQLLWVRTRIDARVDPTFAFGLLDGSIKVRGLTVEQDLRWRCVKRLASKGQIPESVIDNEYTLDHTEFGRQQHLPALAAQPTVAAKKRAWLRSIDPDGSKDMDMHARTGMLNAFWQPDQDLLLEPWLGKWLDALPGVWTASSHEEAANITEALYPAALPSRNVVKAADKALELGLPAPAMRVLAECRDETLRCLRALEFNE